MLYVRIKISNKKYFILMVLCHGMSMCCFSVFLLAIQHCRNENAKKTELSALAFVWLLMVTIVCRTHRNTNFGKFFIHSHAVCMYTRTTKSINFIFCSLLCFVFIILPFSCSKFQTNSSNTNSSTNNRYISLCIFLRQNNKF